MHEQEIEIGSGCELATSVASQRHECDSRGSPLARCGECFDEGIDDDPVGGGRVALNPKEKEVILGGRTFVTMYSFPEIFN